MKLERPWVFLSGITKGKEYIDIMAAADIDGIGVLAHWEKDDDGSWTVWVVDTEQGSILEEFEEGEYVPPTPPILIGLS